jgi:hypothetical protein
MSVFSFFFFKLHFTISNEVIGEKAVGEMITNKIVHFWNDQKIKNMLKNPKYVAIKLFSEPFDVCLFPNNQLLFTNQNSLTIYDQNFKLMKKLDKIDDRALFPLSVCLNKRNEIYMSCYNNNCVFMMDLNFKKIKSTGSQNILFNQPYGLCCKNELLYVCDCLNQRIQILSLDFIHVETIVLTYEPLSIKISDSTIGIFGVDGTYFYDLESKILKNQYFSVFGRLSEFDEKFYVISFYRPKQAYVFDKEGNLVENIKIDGFGQFISRWWDGCILCFNNNLIITSYTSNQILKLSLQIF